MRHYILNYGYYNLNQFYFSDWNFFLKKRWAARLLQKQRHSKDKRFIDLLELKSEQHLQLESEHFHNNQMVTIFF